MNINEIELACNLATASTIDELVIPLQTNGEYSIYESEEDLFNESEDNTLTWKEEPQEVFNRWYDYYLDEIENCKE